MSGANAAALLAAVGGYLIYSRILTPGDFARYTGALALAKAGTAIVDGGLKIALIREGGTAKPGVIRGAFLASGVLTSLGSIVLGVVLYGLTALGDLEAYTALFLWLYAESYFATYPLLVIPLAELERNLRFIPVARAEGMSVCIEYALPAALWLGVSPGFWTFIASAWIARTLRMAMILASVDGCPWLRRSCHSEWREVRALLRVGAHVQAASLASMLRDNLHFLLIAPIYGRVAAGMYAWAIQLCGMTSQVFVQTTARVLLPSLLASTDRDRWHRTLSQVVWLTILTFPPLLCLKYLAPAVNVALFHGKWVVALSLLPFIIWRMLPGLATTPLGSMLLVRRTSRTYAVTSAAWAVAEVITAAICIYFFGEKGLALSYSFMAWFGVILFTVCLADRTALFTVIRAILFRPSILLAVVLTTPVGILAFPLRSSLVVVVAYAALVCLVSISSEPRVWRLLHGSP